MPKEKRSITITISDLDDEKKVLEALSKFFTSIFMYYLQEGKLVLFTNVVMSCAVYFGGVMKEAGINPEDYQDNEPA